MNLLITFVAQFLFEWCMMKIKPIRKLVCITDPKPGSVIKVDREANKDKLYMAINTKYIKTKEDYVPVLNLETGCIEMIFVNDYCSVVEYAEISFKE